MILLNPQPQGSAQGSIAGNTRGIPPVVTVGAGRVVLTLSVLKTDGVKGTGEAATVPSTTEQPCLLYTSVSLAEARYGVN